MSQLPIIRVQGEASLGYWLVQRIVEWGRGLLASVETRLKYGDGHRPGAELVRLRRENRRLRDALSSLAREARKNETISRRLQELELSLLHATSLRELAHRIVHETESILGLDAVSLVLHDSGEEIRELLSAEGHESGQLHGVLILDQGSFGGSSRGSDREPVLGPYHGTHARLFDGLTALGSVALLPLISGDRLIGSLNLASADPARYTASHAYDFLSRLAGVSALCLQNAINRQRLLVSGYTDLLTGWHNRRYLHMRMTEEVERAVRYAEPISCLILDLDHFKRINDLHGHLTGDHVLREIAARIKAQLRSSDLAVRFGGEEFVVFLVRTNGKEAVGVAERIRSAIASAPVRTRAGRLLQITLSGGLAELHPGGERPDAVALGNDLLDRADAALYRAKAGGRNRIVRHEMTELPDCVKPETG